MRFKADYTMKDPLKMSLIIPAHNEEKYIGECLDYALKNGEGKFYEIIVVDNVSTDKTAEIAGSHPGVRVVRENKKGPTNARQRGFLEARGDILAFIDADTHMPEGWAKQALSEFENHPDVASLTGPYMFYDMSRFKQFFVRLYWYCAVPLYWLVGYMGVFGNFVVRREVLEKMSGFDTTVPFYGDDTAAARRVSKFGKAKFKSNFIMYSSARRLKGQGIIQTAFFYVTNFFSQVFLHRTVTKKYIDIR